MTTTNTSSKSREASGPPPQAPVVPTENPAAYEDRRFWSDPPWGDTYWCEMCSTCMRWRHSHRAGGRVCVTAFNFNFPLVIIEQGRCNEYRPVPGAEGLWADDFVEEDEEYLNGRRRDAEGVAYEDDADRNRPGGARRRSRRRQRRGPGAPGPVGGSAG